MPNIMSMFTGLLDNSVQLTNITFQKGVAESIIIKAYSEMFFLQDGVTKKDKFTTPNTTIYTYIYIYICIYIYIPEHVLKSISKSKK